MRLSYFFRRANRIQPINMTCRIRSERPCPPNKYRTPSGVCNNVRHPAWGARGSPFLKLLSSTYSDGKKSTCYIFIRTFERILLKMNVKCNHLYMIVTIFSE